MLHGEKSEIYTASMVGPGITVTLDRLMIGPSKTTDRVGTEIYPIIPIISINIDMRTHIIIFQ